MPANIPNNPNNRKVMPDGVACRCCRRVMPKSAAAKVLSESADLKVLMKMHERLMKAYERLLKA